MSGYWLHRIEALDPVRDHQEIYRISSGFEFPWDYYQAFHLSMFGDHSVPTITRLLSATREFVERPQRRYDDTALLMMELAEHGYDSPRGRQALSVINRMHGRYQISNEDMLYILSAFVFYPIDWIDRFGWRPLHDHERQATLHYFTEVGKRMGIKDIPPDLESFRRFKGDYERTHVTFTETNHEVGTHWLNTLCSWYPARLRPAVSAAVRSLLDAPIRDALGFPPAAAWAGHAVRAVLRARARIVRFLPPRRQSRLLCPGAARTYPRYPVGHTPADLGAPEPPADIDPTLLRRSVGQP